MRPLGKGMPRMPATPVVSPSRKMSQWKPGGFLSGNSVPWAMRDETVVAASQRESPGNTRGVLVCNLTIVIKPEQDGQ